VDTARLKAAVDAAVERPRLAEAALAKLTEEELDALVYFLNRGEAAPKATSSGKATKPCPYCGEQFANLGPHVSRAHPVEWEANRT
jgi:hypothetical protein